MSLAKLLDIFGDVPEIVEMISDIVQLIQWTDVVHGAAHHEHYKRHHRLKKNIGMLTHMYVDEYMQEYHEFMYELENGDKKWYNRQGKLQSFPLHSLQNGDTSPAIIYHDGSQEWYDNGLLHSFSSPNGEENEALIHANGSRAWFSHGKPHRLNKPAIIHADGSMEWFYNGYRHRLHDNDSADNDEFRQNTAKIFGESGDCPTCVMGIISFHNIGNIITDIMEDDDMGGGMPACKHVIITPGQLPAIVNADNSQYWFISDFRHRAECSEGKALPAEITAQGVKYYYKGLCYGEEQFNAFINNINKQ